MKNIVFMVLLSFFLTNIIGCGGSESTTPVETLSLPLQKGYVIDSPVSGLDYECGDIQGVTDDKGMFECRELPVTFKIGNLTLGKISQIPSDKKVYPQDILGIKRMNFTDPRLVELARFLQSLDDDGDIEKVIKIIPDIKESFIQEQIFVKLDDSKLRELVESAGKTYVSKDAAISHLKDTIEKLISIDIYPKTITLALGEQTSLHAQGTYSNGIKRDITDEVVWSSSNPSVATINGENVEAKNVGTTTIKAELKGINKTVTLTVKKASLVTLEINATNSQLAAGTETKLYAQGVFTDNTTADLTDQVIWSSSDKSKATVDTTGIVKALAKGTVIITAKKGNIAATQTLSISDAKLTGIELVPQTQNIAKGLSTKISVNGNYTDGQTQTLTSGVDFNSSDESIVTIDASGNITAIKEGTVTVNAKTGLYTAQATVTVTPPILSSIKINPLEDTNLPKGKTVQLSVSGTYSDKTTEDVSDQVTWSSVTPEIATVSPQGMVKALDTGTATIKASVGKTEDEISINIGDALLEKIVVLPSLQSIAKGLTGQVEANGTYSDGISRKITDIVSWESNDTNIASIDTTGKVTTLNEGQVLITATMNNVSAKAIVEVTAPQLVSLKLSDISEIEKGKTLQLVAKGTYTDNTIKDISSNVTWTSSNTSIVSIDDKGLLSGLDAGSVTVIATFDELSDQKEITILPPTLVSITLSPEGDINLTINKKIQLTATGKYSDGNSKNISADVSWSSSSDLVAISNDGEVMGYGIGTVTITARLGNQQATKMIKVTDIPYTEVSGQIREDTTWTLDKSPYKITERIQIADNVLLTIESGVRVYGYNNAIEVFGTINVNGQKNEMVLLKDINIYPVDNSSKVIPKIKIDYADISGGSLYYKSVHSTLSLKNSIVANLNHNIYIWYPYEDCYIENNIFNNIGKISIGIDKVKVYIQNNAFIKNTQIENWANYNNIDDLIVEYNSFLSTSEIVVAVNNDSGKMNALNNYWGTTDEAKIAAMIWDNYDDLALNEIKFKPYLTEPDPDTPIYNPNSDNNLSLQFEIESKTRGAVLINGVLQQNSHVILTLHSNAEKSFRVKRVYVKDANGKLIGETTAPSILNNNLIYPSKDISIELTIGYGGAVVPLTEIFELEEIETGKEFSVINKCDCLDNDFHL